MTIKSWLTEIAAATACLFLRVSFSSNRWFNVWLNPLAARMTLSSLASKSSCSPPLFLALRLAKSFFSSILAKTPVFGLGPLLLVWSFERLSRSGTDTGWAETSSYHCFWITSLGSPLKVLHLLNACASNAEYFGIGANVKVSLNPYPTDKSPPPIWYWKTFSGSKMLLECSHISEFSELFIHISLSITFLIHLKSKHISTMTIFTYIMVQKQAIFI